jgi:two-component system response regulator HydG
MRALFAEVDRFAPVKLPILIRGESGTGKELVAKAIRHVSSRRGRPFGKLNCADFTRDLLRSELFGHERGAFTGAVSKTAGALVRLDGGTVFLDEVGELAPDAQAMLLQFLQEGEGRPVGAAQNVKLDMRLIAATHRDLEAAVEQGTFREDFYYRLSWVVLEVPPLRERREDISLLVEHFRVQANSEYGLAIEGFTRGALAVIEGDSWPGNVRELEATVKPAMIRRCEGWVRPEDIVLLRLRRGPTAVRVPAGGMPLAAVQRVALDLASSRGEVRRRDVMARCGISREAARRVLVGLERAGVVERAGNGRGSRYVLVDHERPPAN